MRRLVIHMAKMTPDELKQYMSSLPATILTVIDAICRRIIDHVNKFTVLNWWHDGAPNGTILPAVHGSISSNVPF